MSERNRFSPEMDALMARLAAEGKVRIMKARSELQWKDHVYDDGIHDRISVDESIGPEQAPGLLTTKEPCQVHKHHQPIPHSNDRHHVWPLGEGGPNIAANTVTVCPNGHRNIHEMMRLLKIHRGVLPYSVRRTFGLEERRLAQLGYDRMMRRAM